ncbi:MAG: DNA-processing protein DprA [Bacillota bacterium]
MYKLGGSLVSYGGGDTVYSEKACLLCILKVHGLGPKNLKKLKNQFGTYREIWEAPIERVSAVIGYSLAQGLNEVRRNCCPDEELSRCRSLNIEVLAEFEKEYPQAFREIHSPPPLVFYRGNLKALEGMGVAVVGSRRATPYGKMVARKLGRDLALAGMVVVSGMARGVDSESHWGCLEGGGMTIGVLGNGIDVVYPRENRVLYSRVEKQGLLISEYPPGAKPEPGNFPVRNRLISALSRGVVVVEAQEKSGAMITVGYALEQGKDVFAVPGPVTSLNSRGPHILLQEGARLVSGVEDILQEWGMERQPVISKVNSTEGGSPNCLLLDYIGYEPVHLDRILDMSKLTPGEAASQLLQLEIAGKIKSLPGNIYVRL